MSYATQSRLFFGGMVVFVLVVSLLSAARSEPTESPLEAARREIIRLETVNATLQAQVDGCKVELGAALHETNGGAA